jgi:hypothetical protein
MFQKTLTAIALAAAVGVTAPPAHAAWFVPSAQCQSIEDMYRSFGQPAVAHTPDEIIQDLGPEVRDETAAVARKGGVAPHPEILRVLNFGGPHGSVIFVANQKLCSTFAGQLPVRK